MPTDTSDARAGVIPGVIPCGVKDSAKDSANNARDHEAEIGRDGEGAALPAADYSLKFRGTLFGSTLAKVFSAVDRAGVGETVSICTNDP